MGKMKRKILLSIASFVVLLFFGMLFSFQFATSDEIELADELRSKQSGKTLELSKGKIYYEWYGPETGEVIVMVHGFSTPRFIFYKNVEVFANAGYHVLAFDHFGRGFSDHLDSVYDKDFFDSELLEFLVAMKLQKPIYLLGYSLGGGIATVFTSRHPEWVKKLILIAPVGFVPEFSGRNKLVLIPVLGDWLMAVIGKKNLLSSFQEDANRGLVSNEIVKKYAEQLHFKRYRHALLSTMRNYPMQNLSREYKILGEKDIPTLILWGTLDSTVPYSGASKIQELFPKSKLATFEGVEHSIVYSHPEKLNQMILGFLGNKN